MPFPSPNSSTSDGGIAHGFHELARRVLCLVAHDVDCDVFRARGQPVGPRRPLGLGAEVVDRADAQPGELDRIRAFEPVESARTVQQPRPDAPAVGGGLAPDVTQVWNGG